MKHIISFSLLFLFSVTKSQTFEEKSAKKACECLAQYQEIQKEQINSCISQSIAKTIEESNDKKDKRKFKNMMEAAKTIKTVQNMVLQNCLTKKEDTINSSNQR